MTHYLPLAGPVIALAALAIDRWQPWPTRDHTKEEQQ